MDDKQKSESYFNRHSNTVINRNGYWSYDYRITSKILMKRNVKNLIDIGCGNGAFLEMFHKAAPGVKLSGLDLSREMVARSRQRLPEVDIVEGDAENMPFTDKTFEAVSCHMSIHHHPRPEKSLSEMYRILMKNGTVVINELTGPKWLRRFMNWCFTKWPTGDHAVYSRAEMEGMLRAAGFRNIRSRMVTPFSYVSVGRKTEEKPAMIKLSGLSDEQVSEISHRIADAFFDYEYNEEDVGLIKFISTREDMFTYMNAIVRAAYKSGVLYTTSERQEGYLMLSGEGAGGSVGFTCGMKMIMAEKKALGGFGNMKKFISACFCDGGTIETRMWKAKRKFLRIEMLVVRKEYQGQGFMRQMMKFSYHLADKKHVPVILDTDDKDKAARYEHLGMKLDRVRSCGDRFHMYDLIRE